MSTEISIEYRPVRIGFLVRDGHVEDLVRAAEINTILLGGINNPIIPISSDTQIAHNLTRAFDCDVLYPIVDDPELGRFLSEYPDRRDPFATNDVFGTSENGRLTPRFFDIRGTIWLCREEVEGGHGVELMFSNFCYPTWASDHPLAALYTIAFGRFPTELNLSHDYATSFTSQLRPIVVNLDGLKPLGKDDFSVSMTFRTTPLGLTRFRLSDDGGQLRDSGKGLFFGHSGSFSDLLWFWNVRATGVHVEFIPLDHLDVFESVGSTHIRRCEKELDRVPSHITSQLSAYCTVENHETVKVVVAESTLYAKMQVFPCNHHVRWNGANATIETPRFLSKSALASTTESVARSEITIALPESDLVQYADENESFTVAFRSPHGQEVFSGKTLDLPRIPELNRFYGVEIIGNALALKVDKRGVRTVCRQKTYSITLAPIPYGKLIRAVFGLVSLEARPSQPGIIAQQIIEKLGGMAFARIFQITGVRDLLKRLGKDDTITRSEATNRIAGSNFDNFIDLFLNQPITKDHVFDMLLSRDFFRAGLRLRCSSCRLRSWLGLREIDDFWDCSYCGFKNRTSLQLKDEGKYWRYRKSGLFGRDNHQEGAIPVLLTLLRFMNLFFEQRPYSTGLDLKEGDFACEVDLCLIEVSPFRSSVILAECKSDGSEINAVDTKNLKTIARRFEQLPFEVYLVFAKTASAFSDTELDLIRELRREHISCIVFDREDLEWHLMSGARRGTSQPMEFHAFAAESDRKFALNFHGPKISDSQ